MSNNPNDLDTEEVKDTPKPQVFDVRNMSKEQVAALRAKLHYTYEASLNQHYRLRREKALYLLTHPEHLYYMTRATGYSMETLRIKLKRLLDPHKIDTPEAEQQDFDVVMKLAQQLPCPPTDLPSDLTFEQKG